MTTRKDLQERQTDRIVYLDYLRVFALILIIIIHVSATNWYNVEVNSVEWQTFNIFDSIARCGLPIFVMISGSIFLNRDIPIKKLYSKYILRLAVSFVVWSIIYAFFDGMSIRKLITGHYHMWFIFMIIGIYMCVPFIKAIVSKTDYVIYYLVLWFLFTSFIPEIVILIRDFANEKIINIVDIINSDINNMDMYLVLGYVGYFVLGYYVDKISLSKKQRIAIYILGAMGCIFTVGMDAIVALRTNKPCGNYYGFFNVNVLFPAIAVFVWFKNRKFNNDTINRVFQRLSKYCFGAFVWGSFIDKSYSCS